MTTYLVERIIVDDKFIDAKVMNEKGTIEAGSFGGAMAKVAKWVRTAKKGRRIEKVSITVSKLNGMRSV